MQPVPDFFTGNDWQIVQILQEEGSPADLSAASDISAAIVSSDGNDAALLVGPVTCSAGASGANWAAGEVAIVFPSAQTDVTDYGTRYLEVQVTLNSLKKTWPRYRVNIKKGLIP